MIARARVLPVAVLLAGCSGEPVEIATMEGFSYEWVFFNHRLSYLHAQVAPASDAGGRVGNFAVVGGTSTTGVPPDLADTCDPDTCGEFPVHDSANVRLDAGFLVSSDIVGGIGAVTLEAGSGGTDGTVTIDVPKAKGEVAVALAGLVIDTDHLVADGIEHCYDPAFGWHPTRIAVSLGEPTLGDDVVTVPVSATFRAGNSLEEERVCIDDINEGAVASVQILVTAVVGKEVATLSQDLDQTAAYTGGDLPFDPDAQPDPDPATRALSVDTTDAVLGWTAIDYTFHVGDPEGRGAYLRRLDVAANAETGLASGHANNYSPGTQLSGFDYAFSGTVQAISVPGAAVTRSTYTAELPADLDEITGAPIVTAFDL